VRVWWVFKVSHDDLLLLARTAQRIARTVALDLQQHQHDYSPRQEARARSHAAGRGSTHLGAFPRPAARPRSAQPPPPAAPSAAVGATRGGASTAAAAAAAFSPPEATVQTAGELSTYLRDSYFGSTAAASTHTSYSYSDHSPSKGTTRRTRAGTNPPELDAGAGGSQLLLAAEPAAPESSRSWTLSCENGLQVEVISDEPRQPLRFLRRRDRRRTAGLAAGPASAGAGAGAGFAGVAANAPLFKFQVAACYVIAHSTTAAGAYIVRVDDLAFTVKPGDTAPR
jgi:hypothetical protein